MKPRAFACRLRGAFQLGVEVDTYRAAPSRAGTGFVAICLGFWAIGVQW